VCQYIVLSRLVKMSRDLQAMMAPWIRLLLAPLLRIKVTGPSVVGVHCSVVVLPAEAIRPPTGILKALGPSGEFDCAKARSGAATAARIAELEKRILIMYFVRKDRGKYRYASKRIRR